MKRIEVVITPWSLDAFKEVAPRLGIAEFDLVEVYRSGCATIQKNQRVYRGREFAIDLLPRLRVEFVLFDDNVQSTLHGLLELVHPDSIAIFKLDQTVLPVKGHSAIATRLEQRMSGRGDEPPHQIMGFVPRNGTKDQDRRSDRPVANADADGSPTQDHR
jgi:nitrogen regulatory protein P-II 1